MQIIAALLTLVFSVAVTPTTGWAQGFPYKPVRLVSPFPPGGGSDAVARVLAQALSEQLEQQVIVDARGGAAGMIGTDAVAKAPADGYTLLLGNLSPQSILPATKKKLPYNPVKDFTPISMVAVADYALAIHPSLPARNPRDFVALAKSSRDRILYASSGALGAPHLAGEYLNLFVNGKLLHVPYKGTGPAAIAVMTGETMMMFGSAPSILPHAKTGRLRLIATTGAKRTLPDVATLSEVLPGYVMTQWYGVIAPAGTPARVLERLHGEIRKANANPKVLQAYSAIGVQPTTNSPIEFQAFMANEIRKWSEVVAKANLVFE
ncbi:MAG: Bug family tripartite tricarboxylate transporter substrate binding protein [Burkholderiales bacterium]